MTGPLSGLRILELGGIGPGPHAAMMLADLGADVVRVDRPSGGLKVVPAGKQDWTQRGRRNVPADIKTDEGRAALLALFDVADVVIEGFRPGAAERMGIGPVDMLARNPRLIYARMTGWGQDGPLATRAGHDINYIGLTGALHAIGTAGARPTPPINLVGDFGGGSTFLVMGILAALFERGSSGRGQVVDAAIIDGTSVVSQMIWGLRSAGLWSDEPAANLLDTGCPFYDTYACADGKYVAVGSLEPQFYAEMVAGLGLCLEELPKQMDRGGWPRLREIFTARFASKSRDEWAAQFTDTDACVTPVLAWGEVAAHPHMAARGTVAEIGGTVQAAPAPRFSRTPAGVPTPPPDAPSDLDDVLKSWGAAGG
ncbi:MAG: CaiB/BaiF CoA transferase family protein [Sporichthyaceae bacterium]